MKCLICTLRLIIGLVKIKQGWMGRACSTNEEEEKRMQDFWKEIWRKESTWETLV